ncbi:hypothetical protein EUGRSUZ_F02991 [Eucalyptus grandis]|uniref:Uncharacterized protein n=2 Tax=Eucalyptus grandis TaxID=71139 RepID=A0ACC3KLJ2_EUCGR|nr:hypothetical protein EUGRSUZ_F02991 [Eucalyptus grandis]
MKKVRKFHPADQEYQPAQTVSFQSIRMGATISKRIIRFIHLLWSCSASHHSRRNEKVIKKNSYRHEAYLILIIRKR